MRKLRPVEGYRDLGARFRKGEEESDPDAAQRRRRLGIDRRWKFALWPDEDADAEGETETERGREPQLLTGAAAGWDEFRRICESGFDATPYACGILARCIEWVVEPTYRITGSDAYRSYGQTGCERLGPGSGDRRPFKIRIDVAADLMWPLLVDEYSPAEKAAATTYVAVTMLHEISVSWSGVPRRCRGSIYLKGRVLLTTRAAACSVYRSVPDVLGWDEGRAAAAVARPESGVEKRDIGLQRSEACQHPGSAAHVFDADEMGRRLHGRRYILARR